MFRCLLRVDILRVSFEVDIEDMRTLVIFTASRKDL
jgi:hypothetical protein